MQDELCIFFWRGVQISGSWERNNLIPSPIYMGCCLILSRCITIEEEHKNIVMMFLTPHISPQQEFLDKKRHGLPLNVHLDWYWKISKCKFKFRIDSPLNSNWQCILCRPRMTVRFRGLSRSSSRPRRGSHCELSSSPWLLLSWSRLWSSDIVSPRLACGW